MSAKELERLEAGNITWVKGAKVLVTDNSGSRAIRPIDRITDGRGGTIYVGDNAFDSKGWRRGGDGWSRTSIETLTPEREEALRKEFRIKNFRYRLRKMDWSKLSDTDVEAVAATIMETEAWKATNTA